MNTTGDSHVLAVWDHVLHFLDDPGDAMAAVLLCRRTIDKSQNVIVRMRIALRRKRSMWRVLLRQDVWAETALRACERDGRGVDSAEPFLKHVDESEALQQLRSIGERRVSLTVLETWASGRRDVHFGGVDAQRAATLVDSRCAWPRPICLADSELEEGCPLRMLISPPSLCFWWEPRLVAFDLQQRCPRVLARLSVAELVQTTRTLFQGRCPLQGPGVWDATATLRLRYLKEHLQVAIRQGVCSNAAKHFVGLEHPDLDIAEWLLGIYVDDSAFKFHTPLAMQLEHMPVAIAGLVPHL